MNTTIAVIAVALAFQTGAPEQGFPASQVHAPPTRDSITEGLPAQVVADLARRALRAPEDEQTWTELQTIVETSRSEAGAWSAVTASVNAAYVFAAGSLESGANWASLSAGDHPRVWVGALAFFTVLLVGFRSRRDSRHVARTAPVRPHRKIGWSARARSWGSARRRVGVPQADYLLGRGLPAREVARQTGLSRDLVRLVHFCSTDPDDRSPDDTVLHPPSSADREGGSSAAGSFARSDDGPPDEHATSVVSVIA